MQDWSKKEFFEHLRQEPWFTSEAIAAACGIMDWAGKQQRVSTHWSGPKVPIFNASANDKRFLSIMAKKGWDLEIPFCNESNYLLERANSEQVIARIEQMGIETVNPQPLSPDHRRAIKLASVNPHLGQFLELLDWIVAEIYKERKLI